MVYLVVTRVAQRHEVAFVMRTAFGHRKYVVHLVHHGHPTFLQAHLAQRMLGSVTVADTRPRSAVLLVDIRSAFVLVIFAPGFFPVLFTVLPVTQVGAARVRAGPQRSLWHVGHLLRGFRIMICCTDTGISAHRKNYRNTLSEPR